METGETTFAGWRCAGCGQRVIWSVTFINGITYCPACAATGASGNRTAPKAACPYDMRHVCGGCADHDREIHRLRAEIARLKARPCFCGGHEDGCQYPFNGGPCRCVRSEGHSTDCEAPYDRGTCTCEKRDHE